MSELPTEDQTPQEEPEKKKKINKARPPKPKKLGFGAFNEMSNEQLELTRKMAKDILQLSGELGRRQARFLVDHYYQIQEHRKRAANQIKGAEKADEPHLIVQWMAEQTELLERQLDIALGRFAFAYRVGKWLQSLCGIGNVLSAGLLSELDVRRRPHAGYFWSFAGFINTPWEKGQKRPWNASLKCLCYKCGESFVKVQNLPSDYYGKLFAKRKQMEWSWNLEGRNAQAAFESSQKVGKGTVTYDWNVGCVNREQAEQLIAGTIGSLDIDYGEPGSGIPMLNPDHIHSRARRWVIKLFLSHVHHVMFEDYYGQPPAKPYVHEKIKDQMHTHYYAPPNWPYPYEGKNLRELLGDEPPLAYEVVTP